MLRNNSDNSRFRYTVSLKRKIKIEITVAFSLGAHTNPIIVAKCTPFPGMRDGWKEIGGNIQEVP